jgi:protein arginine N-methyltransferase 5
MALELMLEDGLIDERFEFVGKIRATEGELNSLGSDDEGVIDLEDEEYIYGEGGEMVDVDLYQVTILVVGAGRGPLVRESINAVSRVSSSMSQNGGKRRAVRANIIAIEKNPSAVLYLRSLKGSDPSWNGHVPENVDNLLKERNTIGRSNVSIIMCDMRDATKHPMLRNMIQNPKHRADVVVSELLGSFGDNELSPECLDGVQLCGLLKEGCVSIPQR